MSPERRPIHLDRKSGRWVEIPEWETVSGEEPLAFNDHATTQRRRAAIFTLVCIAAIGLSAFAILRGDHPNHSAPDVAIAARVGDPADTQAASPSPGSPVVATQLDHLTEPYALVVSRAGNYSDNLALLPVSATGGPRSVITTLSCSRVDYAAGRGVCLQLKDGNATATVFDAHFNALSQHTLPGVPSRTRVAPSGKVAAMTTFTNGASYSGVFSTATTFLDLTTGADLGNMEGFTVTENGRRIQSVDFNFWGVTWMKDGNGFYATLGTGSHRYLVQGDLAGHRATVLTDGVECPSLSPDNARIAFKKANSDGGWRLWVMDLRTLQGHPVAEPSDIDDQAAWLDNTNLVYQGYTDGNTWTVPSDGTGNSRPFVPLAKSPVVVRP